MDTEQSRRHSFLSLGVPCGLPMITFSLKDQDYYPRLYTGENSQPPSRTDATFIFTTNHTSLSHPSTDFALHWPIPSMRARNPFTPNIVPCWPSADGPQCFPIFLLTQTELLHTANKRDFKYFWVRHPYASSELYRWVSKAALLTFDFKHGTGALWSYSYWCKYWKNI